MNRFLLACSMFVYLCSASSFAGGGEDEDVSSRSDVDSYSTVLIEKISPVECYTVFSDSANPNLATPRCSFSMVLKRMASSAISASAPSEQTLNESPFDPNHATQNSSLTTEVDLSEQGAAQKPTHLESSPQNISSQTETIPYVCDGSTHNIDTTCPGVGRTLNIRSLRSMYELRQDVELQRNHCQKVSDLYQTKIGQPLNSSDCSF